MKRFRYSFLLTVVILAIFSITVSVFAQSDQEKSFVEKEKLVENEDGTYSMQNGIFLRKYEGYSEEAQIYLSALDACRTIIASYSPIIDPYIYGEKSFAEEQWDVIATETKYMSGYSCSYVMQNPVPADLSSHEQELFFASYHLMVANELLLESIEESSDSTAELAMYYFTLANEELKWWDDAMTEK